MVPCTGGDQSAPTSLPSEVAMSRSTMRAVRLKAMAGSIGQVWQLYWRVAEFAFRRARSFAPFNSPRERPDR